MHTLSQRATDAYEAARHALARFAGAGRGHEVVFTSGTTESLNLVAHGLSDAGIGPAWLRPGDEIVVSALEHHANLVPWQAAARRSGARLKVLLPDAQGRVDEAGLARLLGPRTRVFALTACANATGYCPPYAELLALAARAGALTVLDAAQSASHALPAIDKLACDFMAFSSHKMYGPMGIGVLVGRRDARDKLAPLPARLEGGTPNVGGAVGIAAAADFIDGIGRDLIDTHLSNLRRAAAAGLAALPGVHVLAPDEPATAIASFAADGVHPHDIGTLLDERGIAVRTGHHCAQPLLDHLGLGPTTRASFGLYNTLDEVERLIDGVAHALEVLR